MDEAGIAVTCAQGRARAASGRKPDAWSFGDYLRALVSEQNEVSSVPNQGTRIQKAHTVSTAPQKTPATNTSISASFAPRVVSRHVVPRRVRLVLRRAAHHSGPRAFVRPQRHLGLVHLRLLLPHGLCLLHDERLWSRLVGLAPHRLRRLRPVRRRHLVLVCPPLPQAADGRRGGGQARVPRAQEQGRGARAPPQGAEHDTPERGAPPRRVRKRQGGAGGARRRVHLPP